MPEALIPRSGAPEDAVAEAMAVRTVPAVAVAVVVDTGGHIADGAVCAGGNGELIHYKSIER